MSTRGYFDHDGLRFSYLEEPVEGRRGTLVILHAHWMGASDFAELMPRFAPGWRVLALDQRGHGETDHGGVHSIEAYLGDVDAFLTDRDVTGPVVLLGHSFGGMVANLYAAQHSDRVCGIIMEDIEVARDDHDDFMLPWAGHFPTRQALEDKIGARLTAYLKKSMIKDEEGWRLTFEPEEVLQSERALNGDHWPEWLSHDCPALVIRGTRSKPVDGEVLAEMAERRPNTELVRIRAGHSVHIDAPALFIETVNAFIAHLPAA